MSASEGRDLRGAARRQHPRIPAPPLRVSSLAAQIHDVSHGGVSLTSRSPLRSGDRLQLLLTDALVHWTQELEAEVVWSCEGRVGMRWVGLTEAQEKWLEDRFRAWDQERRAGTDKPLDEIRWSV